MQSVVSIIDQNYVTLLLMILGIVSIFLLVYVLLPYPKLSANFRDEPIIDNSVRTLTLTMDERQLFEEKNGC